MAKYVHLELIQVKYMQIIKIPAKHKIEKKKKGKKIYQPSHGRMKCHGK